MPTISDFDDPTFDPFLADELAFGDHIDPFPTIAELRRRAPVVEGEYRVAMGMSPDITMAHLKHYTVLGYDAVQKILGDPATYSNSGYKLNLGISFGESITTMDAPEHTRYRRIFQRVFFPQTVAKWGELIVDPVVSDLMSAFIPNGRADLVQDFTLHYPFRVIYRQLQMPSEDIRVFHKLAIAQTVTAFDPVHGIEAGQKLGDYFRGMLLELRRKPGDDLVSLLAQTEVDGEHLPEDVLVSFLRQLLNAGGDTTYRGTSVLLTGLLQHPQQLEALRSDRSLIPQAIDEALRWNGPVTMAARMTTRDVTLAGVDIPEGAVLDVLLGSANRDETRFAKPDEFDIFRERKYRHLAFAAGPHLCLGQHLARVEMTRAMNAILDRLPGLRLDSDAPPPVIRGAMMRVPRNLHVRFN
jgi:cytochrome P450